MPERKHYGLALLDNCYLYTLDNEFTEGMTTSLSDSFYTYQYRRKLTAPNILLEKEALDGSDRFAVNPEAVVMVVRKAMLKACDLNGDGVLEKDEMEKTKGYIFGITDVNLHGGTIGTPEGIANGYGNVFGGGNIGYVYSGHGTKSGTRGDGNKEGYYYDSDDNLTEDSRVNVEVFAEATAPVSVNGAALIKPALPFTMPFLPAVMFR